MHVNVIIEQSVVDKINTAIYRFPDMETGGQLIGSIGKDAITGSYTVYVADLYHEISQVGTGGGRMGRNGEVYEQSSRWVNRKKHKRI